MNLLLLQPSDCTDAHHARITGRQLTHVHAVHRAKVGDTLRVGLLNGLMGSAEILQLSAQEMALQFVLNEPPPPKLPFTLLVALPRPKMLKRIVQTAASMGVAHLVLLNSYRVEKSFWQTPWLQEHELRAQLILGLEQARDTVLPRITLAPLFKPFVQDELPALCAGTQCLVAHPSATNACPVAVNQPATLAIGPEGGFIPYEVEQLINAGFSPVHLGARILRVETAVTALTARLFTA